MADPLSVTASVLAVATAAIVSIRSLCDTIQSFQQRDKTLKRLHTKLSSLSTILESLVEVINTDVSVLALLESPIGRCRDVCSEFEHAMRKFNNKSKTGLLDWTKLEFMRGNINEFIDAIEGYESTITVGLGTINLRNSKLSLEVLHNYEEMIKETAYNLELRLQNIDEKLGKLNSHTLDSLSADVDLEDEKAVTLQCLRICEDANSFFESLASRERNFLKASPPNNAESNTQGDFEAQMLVRQAFISSQASFAEVIKNLGERLQTVVGSGSPENETERSRLQEDLNVSKQCLQVCQVAREISHQKIHTIGEVIAEEDSDQIVVTTLADLFDVKKALSRGRSAQLIATLTPDNFDRVVEKRYASRFGMAIDSSSQADSSPVVVSMGQKQTVPLDNCVERQTSESGLQRDRPNPNEMKKRYTNQSGRS